MEEKSNSNLQVAILPSPGMGHVIPLIELAKCLVSLHGFHVTLFVLTTDASSAQSQLLQSQTVPNGLCLVDLPTVDITNIVNADAGILTRISIIVRESISSFRSELADMPLHSTVLVVDMFGTDTFEVAEALHMPKYVYFTSTAACLAFMVYFPILDQEIRGEFGELRDQVQVPGCPPIKPVDVVSLIGDRKSEEYTWLLYHSSRLPMADGILINTCETLEPKWIEALRENKILRQIPMPCVYPVGPLIKSAAGSRVREPEECLTWLDTQPPDSVLFICFGSGGTLSEEQLTELAWGLELSQQRFVWVARRPNRTASSSILTSGEDVRDPLEFLPEGFMKRTEGVGFVVPSWAPQIEILCHVAIGGFLTHCGWNSTLESITHGVPVIAWPLFAEQRMNASMLVEELKVAVWPETSPETGVVDRKEIERVVRMVMEGEEGKALRGRVRELRDGVMREFDEGGSSHNSLSQVAREWRNVSKRA